VLVSRQTADALEPGQSLRPAGSHGVKGYSRPVEVLALS
jgi:class 3 adenylate cyclase